jgi:hypothetical protein
MPRIWPGCYAWARSTEVRVPEREIEAVRDLVRARRGTRLFSPTAATRKPSAHHS